MSTANLPDHARRSGRAGTVWQNGDKLGEVVSIEWSVEVEQVAVPIPGSYKDGVKPGGEQLRGTFRFQDVHDRWTLMVLDFLDARRRGDRAAAAFVKFDLTTKLADIGAPHDTRYGLYGCTLFQAEGGFGIDDDLLNRDVPFAFDRVVLLSGFVYVPGGGTSIVTRQ